MTREQYMSKAIEIASMGQGEDQSGFYTDIADLLVDEALQSFSVKIANDKHRAHLLQPATPATIAIADPTNGSTDLSATNILTSHMHLGRLYDANGKAIDYVKHWDDFRSRHSAPYGKYTLRGKKIHARAPNSALADNGDYESAATPLTFYGNIIATATDIPAEITDDACADFALLLQSKRELAGPKKAGSSAGRGEV